MAFDFVKKIFSFGRKPDEKPAAEMVGAEPAPPKPEIPPETPPEPEIQPKIQPEPQTEPQPGPPPAPEREPAPAPQPPEREPAPQPPEPAKPPLEVPPRPEPAPQPPEPAKPPLEVPPQPEPKPEAPVPDTPVEPPAPPQEVPPAQPPQEIPSPAPQPAEPAPPGPEIPPDVRASEEAVPVSSGPSDGPLSRREEAGARVTIGRTVERKAEAAPATPAPAARVPWLQRLRLGLSRSSQELSSSISSVFNKRRLGEDTLQDLEDVLIRADLGVETAMRITDTLASGRYGRDIAEADVRSVMATEMEKVLSPVALPLELDLSHKPHVILVVGVNGTGKTTTIGKLAAKLSEGGLSVMLAAGDTFRAAAIEQLKIWGERTGAPVVSSRLGADAASLTFDAYEAAKAAGADVLIVDTAGRLQNKVELMAELEKIVRVLARHDPEAPHTVLQTVDATTGQNALNQVEIFRNVAGVNGLVMTKLDGTARGGILVAIAAKHRLPVYFIGVGEQVDDLEPFSAGDFAKAIAGVE